MVGKGEGERKRRKEKGVRAGRKEKGERNRESKGG